jgi:hypothetical protein
MSGRALETRRRPERHVLAERWEKRLAIPVLFAAVVSVPAVFLMTVGGVPALIGRVLNWLSAVLLVGEAMVPIVLSKDILDWLRAHKWELGLAGLTVPAVVFAVGPVQILRIVLSVGTLRVLRVRRIVSAGQVLARELRLRASRKRLIIGLALLIAAAFVGTVLADPDARTRQILAEIVARIGLAPTILTGAFLAAVLVLAIRWLMRTTLFRKVRAAREGKPSTPLSR